MTLSARKLWRIGVCAVLPIALAVATFAQYTITVNNERLINAQNEPQNWLMMNGDYGVNPVLEALPDQPRQRQEPPDGLGPGARRHAGCRTERPGKRGQPADRQRLHVHDRRLGHGL